ncbi:ABC transporter permease [Actinoplanes subtropicus]|uniref:ABC transporter permease n=1 Tax=Actinoplanes subtropicus TaxID=543632 RepID=UPI0004C30A0B|nr:ABC transporter permease [Actinoplanes subtropicus]
MFDLRLAVKLLRHRAGPAVATLIALAAGVLILTAVGTLVESGLRFRPAPVLYRAADVVVAHREVTWSGKDFTGDTETASAALPAGTVDAALAERIRRLPGVSAVAGDDRVVIDAPAAVGHGFGVFALTGRPAVDAPRADDEVVADRRLGVAAGDRLALRVAGVSRTYRVTATADTGAAQVFFTDAQAARLSAHPGRFNAIGVKTSDPAAVRAVAGADAYAGAARGEAEQSAGLAARDLLIQAGSAFGGYVLLLMVFVVAGTVGLSVRHRRRELALLRAVAATAGQVRRLLVAETALLALVAAVPGVPAGLVAARWAHGELIDRGFLPAGYPAAAGWLAAPAAVGVAVLVAVLAALIAGRRVSRIKPVEALGEAAVEPPRPGRVRLVSGLVTLAMAVAAGGAGLAGLGGADTALAGAAGMLYLFVTAVALLAPWINGFAARLLAPALTKLWPASGYLAGHNLRANARGMATVLTALVLAVGFGGSVWFLQDNLERQTAAQSREGVLADRVVVGAGGDAAGQIRELAGVRAATGVRRTSVVVRSIDGVETVGAQAVDPAGLGATMDLGVLAGSLTDLRAGTVALSATRASAAGRHVGDTMSLWLGDGTPASLRVVAIYRRGLGFGDVTLAKPAVAGHLPRDGDDEVLVRTGPGGATALAAWSGRQPGSAVLDAATRARGLEGDLAVGAWLNRMLIGVMVGYAALAAATTMVLTALARRRELALLRLAGVTRRQVRRMVHAEQAVLLGVAVLLGAAIAAVTLGSMVWALTGSPIPYVPPLGWLTVLGGTAALALLTTIWPVRRMLRAASIDDLRVRE